MVADVVESVRLMAADESGFIDRWRQFVAAVRRDVLASLGGRLARSLGDGLLLEFGSPSDAVNAALELHRTAARGNAGRPWDSALQLRIGVYVGPVVVDELDIYGQGVNLAARLAALGRPGDIVVSVEVRDALTDGVGLRLHDLGDCHLKHFDQPVRAFRVEAVGSGHEAGHRARPFDGRPSLAVLPLRPSSAADDAAWGVAVADAIVTSLSGIGALRVVSLLSARALEATRSGAPVPAPQAALALAAGYVLGGSLRSDGARLQVTLQLDGPIVAASGPAPTALRWRESVQIDGTQLFSGSEPVIQALARRLALEIGCSEVRRARTLPMHNLQTYTLYTAGVDLLHRLARGDFELAGRLLTHLMEREPRNAAAHAMLSKWHLLQSVQGWTDDPLAASRRARDSARRAVDLDPQHALALSMQAIVTAQLDGDLHSARELAEAAVAANPQEPHAWLNLGGIHSYLGHAEEAQVMPERAIALSPLDPARFVFEAFLADGRLTAGRWDEAAQAARESIRLNAMHLASHRILTVALSLGGRIDEARAAASDLLKVNPGFSIGAFERRYSMRDGPQFGERLRALRLAGLPP